MAETEVDYLIIGAGVAGMTLRHALSSSRVALIDPHPFRYKLGESIIPEHFRDPALADMRDEVQRLPSDSPKYGSMYIGPDGVAAFPLPPLDYGYASHVRREELESRMASLWDLEIEPERVKRYDATANLVHTDRRTWRVAKQVIDCSGVARVLARAMGLEQELWRSFASWMYLDVRAVRDDRFADFLRDTGRAYQRFDPGVGHPLPQQEYEGWAPSNCTIVWRVRDGMFAWQIPLYQKSVLSFGVTSRHGPVSREDLMDFARENVAPCYETDPRPFDGSSDYNRFHVNNRFSRTASQVADANWILVGDAGFFGEPIYASGTAVAVNQALHVARALNDTGWTDEARADYVARWTRTGESSLAARRYFFAPDGAPDAPPVAPPVAPSSRVFEDRALQGTAFQLTMANNYGRILSGVKEFVAVDEQFASRYAASAEAHRAFTASLTALLTDAGALGAWLVRVAYPAKGGVQVALSHEAMPDLTVPVERARAGFRYFRAAEGFGLTYMSLPDGPYPFEPVTRALLDRLSESFGAAREGWSRLLDDALTTP
jgi:flavin-dependent dehydrogenase